MTAVRRMLIAGRYRLREPVGTGGMGRVWLARDEMLDRDVAIKEFLPPGWMTDEEKARLKDRTLREARSSARLNHPNVVQIYDVVHADGQPWIVMEYVPSRSLHQVLSEDGPLSPGETAKIGIALLDALTAAHRSGVLHRDVKPHNVLIAHDGRTMLTDFGLATFVDDGTVTGPGLIVGSPQYVSPERARDGASTVESDLWSLGATLYAAVEGRSPYARESAMATLMALATEPPDPPERAGLLAPLLTGLLRRDPESRLAAVDVDRRLRTILATEPASAQVVTPAPRRAVRALPSARTEDEPEAAGTAHQYPPEPTGTAPPSPPEPTATVPRADDRKDPPEPPTRPPAPAAPDGEPRRPERPSVLIKGFEDAPALEDSLGRRSIVDVLTELFLTDAGPSGAPQEKPGPQVVVVDGPWGSGKTTVMHLLKKRLEDATTAWEAGRRKTARRRRHLTALGASRLLAKLHRSEDKPRTTPIRDPAPPGPPVAALFEPWAHQTSEQMWAALARTITDAAVPTFCADVNARHRFWFDRNARRLDVAHLRRVLWKNLTSPFLRVAVFALSVPVVLQLMRDDKPTEWWGIAATQWAWIIPVTLLLIGLGHTAGRLLFGRAISFLPAELFAGPVLSRAMVSASRNEPLRDPLNDAQSGYLYLVQRDVKTILEELAKDGRSLVIFIDDLDRCDSRSAVEVIQALNLFLTGALQGCRLVIGLDQVIAAAQLDEIYQHVDKGVFARFGDDPSPGWTFLRKLTHLPLIMPIVGDTSVDLYLSGLLGFPYGDVVGNESATALLGAAARAPGRSDEVLLPQMNVKVERALAARRPKPSRRLAFVLPAWIGPLRRNFVPDGIGSAVRLPAEPIEDVELVALERHQDVRNAIRRTIAGHDDPSGRETKRLLNIWQFYLRLLLRTTPVVTMADGIDLAVNLVTVADILNRWPAAARQLTTVVNGKLGLALLCESAHEHLPWERALIAVRLDGAGYEKSVKKMRSVLLRSDRKAVAAVATEIFLRESF